MNACVPSLVLCVFLLRREELCSDCYSKILVGPPFSVPLNSFRVVE